jgi:hypothetical protein
MPFVILPTNSASGGYDITNSLRFNSGSSDNLSRTPASAVSRQICTYSAWIKISEIATERALISASSDTNNYNGITIGRDSGVLRYYEVVSGSIVTDIKTTQLFRDPSAWYHIVVAIDSTQATSSNRIKIYVNGSQVTSFLLNTVFAQNTNTSFGSNCLHTIGKYADVSAGFFNGYHSEVYFINGQQLTPSSFGETDFDTGIWKPKAYTGTYGTNGFYLQFKNSASLGTDSSGNGNTFTVNNLTSVDQSTDTPTNNFSTWNSLIKYSSTMSLSEGNLKGVTGSVHEANCQSFFTTIAVTQGKWYAEFKVDTVNDTMIGVSNDLNTNLGGSGTGAYNFIYLSSGYGYFSSGDKYNNNTGSAYGNSYTTGDIIGVALDLDNLKLYFSKNGTFQNSGVPTSGATGTGSAYSLTAYSGSNPYFFCVADYAQSPQTTVSANFGSPSYSANSYTDGAGYGNFSYAVPSGYYSLNTKNLATFG